MPIKLQQIKHASLEDATLNLLKETVYKGWPPLRKKCPQELWEYWNFRCDLVIDDGLVLKGDRIIIPKSLRKQVLDTIHLGHQGETKCILIARESVFWPGITNDVKAMVQACSTCARHQTAPPRLPLMQPDLPTSPWEKIGTDLFEYNSKKYLMVVDYYSRFPIVRQLSDIRAETVTEMFGSIIDEFGLCKTILLTLARSSQVSSSERNAVKLESNCCLAPRTITKLTA